MLQTLGLAEKDFIFTPHLLPVNRGILSTIYVRLKAQHKLAEVIALFEEFYTQAPLVRVYGQGAIPDIQSIAHTQYFDVGFALDERTGADHHFRTRQSGKGGRDGGPEHEPDVGFPEATALL
jgi:N-acetyl-gamma-glutamyl-phosphate reductase